MSPTPLTFHRVVLPVPDPESFITPAWTDVLDFFPEYVAQVRARGDRPFPLTPYFVGVATELVLVGARPGRTVEEWTRRFVEHFGVNEFVKYCIRYKDLNESCGE